MIRVVAVFFIMMVMISVGTVYSLKETTQRLQARKQQLSANILKDRAAIKVLRAEMAYLSQPARLQKLSRRFLALSPARPDQLAKSVSMIASRDSGPEKFKPASAPVDAFPLLLPRERPVMPKRDITRPPVRKIGYYDGISGKPESGK
ncbi:MAG: hypothetical protein GXP02_02400 [Alphaproteobacteria bacterium]|nr:hypothetical protein [Alphaproteobacteria bacterium]